MKNKLSDIKQIRSYLLLWFTQMISGLVSAMTAYALVIWSYVALEVCGLLLLSHIAK